MLTGAVTGLVAFAPSGDALTSACEQNTSGITVCTYTADVNEYGKTFERAFVAPLSADYTFVLVGGTGGGVLGGRGAQLTVTKWIAAGTTLYVHPGGNGLLPGSVIESTNMPGGANGGGSAKSVNVDRLPDAGSGGGSSDVSTKSASDGTSSWIDTRLFVAGGGGGDDERSLGGDAGTGGAGTAGQDGPYYPGGGKPGTLTGGGTRGGDGAGNGGVHTGGWGYGGGGGGGGYFGGGGGVQHSGGGGGSSYSSVPGAQFALDSTQKPMVQISYRTENAVHLHSRSITAYSACVYGSSRPDVARITYCDESAGFSWFWERRGSSAWYQLRRAGTELCLDSPYRTVDQFNQPTWNGAPVVTRACSSSAASQGWQLAPNSSGGGIPDQLVNEWAVNNATEKLHTCVLDTSNGAKGAGSQLVLGCSFPGYYTVRAWEMTGVS